MAGVPALTIGLLAMMVLASYMIDRPFGPPGFYRVEQFPAFRPSSSGSMTPIPSVGVVLPSLELLGLLVAGAWCGCFGIYIASRRGQARRATTSIVGTIACATAFVMAWVWVAVAATR
jgi:hypothetical protein